jgi:dihydroorotase
LEHDLVLEGRVVTPSGLRDAEVGVSDGLISEIGHGLRGSRKIKTQRCLIFPGFVDIHVHLREPGWEYKEDFRTGTRAAAHGGVTTVADMPNNPTPATTMTALGLKRRLADEKAVVDVKFYGGVSPRDLHRIEEISEQVVGFKIFLSETTGSDVFPPSELGGAFDIIAKRSKPVSLHCESQAIIDLSRKKLDGVDGDYADLRPPAAEVEAVRNAASAMKGVPGLRANVCHASVRGTLDQLQVATNEGLKLFCEVALHHLYFNRRALEGNDLLKTNPPLRSEEDRQSMLDGLRRGKISFLVTDHAPHTEREKIEFGNAGVPGLDDFAHVVSWLIKDNGVDPSVVAKVASSNPSNFLDLLDRGEISPGKRADFSILDLQSPEKVDKDEILSKCGWSPYEGKVFPGRIRWTISAGETLVDDFELAV